MAILSRLEFAVAGRCGGVASLLVLFAATAAPAQPVLRLVPTSSAQTTRLADPGAVPAHIAAVDGPATLDRDGRTEPALANLPLLSGDRLRTGAGRVEVVFADGSVFDLDTNSDVDFLSDSLLRIRTGRLRLTIARTNAGLSYRIDSAGTTTWIRTSGEYAIQTGDPRAIDQDVRVTVIRGTAELVSGSGRTTIDAGAEAVMTARDAPSLAYTTTTAPTDAFSRWSDETADARTGADEALDASAQYVPDDLREYDGALDAAGDWQYADGYGYVWFPRVGSTWHPYGAGQWRLVAGAGWCWVGSEPWSWPTHHYGRWGLQADRWFWIPDGQWGAAWVSWAGAPGLVAWCPLDIHNRPVVAASAMTQAQIRPRGWMVASTRAFRTAVVPASDPMAHVSTGLRWAARPAPPARLPLATAAAGPLTSPTVLAHAASASPMRNSLLIDGAAAPSNVASSGASSAASPQSVKRGARGADGRPSSRSGASAGRAVRTLPGAGAGSPAKGTTPAPPIDLSRREPHLDADTHEPAQAGSAASAASGKGAPDPSSPSKVLRTPVLPDRRAGERTTTGSDHRSGPPSGSPSGAGAAALPGVTPPANAGHGQNGQK